MVYTVACIIKYPHKRKFYRSTIWKNTGIRVRDGQLLLARARGLAPLTVTLPPELGALPPTAFVEMRNRDTPARSKPNGKPGARKPARPVWGEGQRKRALREDETCPASTPPALLPP
jgi:hypothetical protein